RGTGHCSRAGRRRQSNWRVAMPARCRLSLGFCLALLVGTTLLHPGRATAGEALSKKTYLYKTVGAVPVHADVYQPDDQRVRPVVVWLHGGALIVGSRTAVPKDLLDVCRAEGYLLVSFDYRLAPEVKLPDIIADLRDAFIWLREQGPKLFRAD